MFYEAFKYRKKGLKFLNNLNNPPYKAKAIPTLKPIKDIVVPFLDELLY